MLGRVNTMHPGRVLREEYMEPMCLDTDGLAAAFDNLGNRYPGYPNARA